MQRIINFIIDKRISFLYGILVVLSLILTFQSHNYHQSKYLNSAKWLSGSIYEVSDFVGGYFRLNTVNKNLVEENKELRRLLLNQKSQKQSTDNTIIPFTVTSGRIINNSYSSPRNYITINKGEKDGIKKDMGVITTKGILGIVENTSENFATVQSILNTKSSINAKLKNTDFFGSLTWNARKHTTVQLVDIPRSASIIVGDTIITGGMSSIFPEGIPIGVVKKYELNESKSFFTIDVGLFNDMTNLRTVYILDNELRAEQLLLEKQTINVE